MKKTMIFTVLFMAIPGFAVSDTTIPTEDYLDHALTYNNIRAVSTCLIEKADAYHQAIFALEHHIAIHGISGEVLKVAASIYYNPRITRYTAQEKEYYWGKSYEYWEKYLDYAKIEASLDDIVHAAHAADSYAFWLSEDEEKIKAVHAAIILWDKARKHAKDHSKTLSKKNIATAIAAYEHALPFLEKLDQKNSVRDKAQSLRRKNRMEGNIYRMGDAIFAMTEEEVQSVLARPDFTVELPVEELSVQKIKKKRKKKKKAPTEASISETEEETKSPDLETFLLPLEEAEETKDPFEEEMKSIASAIEVLTVKKPTKKEKKLTKMLERTETRNRLNPPQETKIHTVDPWTVSVIRKVYAEKSKQEEARIVLDRVLAFQSGTDTATVKAALESIKKYFSIQREHSETTVILGHDVSEFYYHQPHGSRGHDWDAGMISRLRRFAQDIKLTFEAIVGDEEGK